MLLTAAPVQGEVLYDWALEPVAALAEKSIGRVEADGFEGRNNRVQIGKLQVYDLGDLMAGEALAPMVRTDLEAFTGEHRPEPVPPQPHGLVMPRSNSRSSTFRSDSG
jgi:hypothetical protein